MMQVLTSTILKQLIDRASDALTGEWVLVGGALLPYLGAEHRMTVDVDLFCLNPKGNAQSLELMALSEKLGLPVETVNQAAAYFFEKAKLGKADLVLLKTGKNARIFRPSATAYLILKINRMSEADLEDCEQWIKFCRERDEVIDRKRVQKTIQACPKSPADERRSRLLELIVGRR